MTKLKKNLNCDETQKLTLWKTQNVTKLKKNSNGDKTKKTQMVTKLKKTQMGTKLKLWQKSNCDKNQIVTKPKLWQNLKLWQKSSCDSSDSSDGSDQTKTFPQKIPFHFFFLIIFPYFFLPKTSFTKKTQTQIVIKLKNSNCDQT